MVFEFANYKNYLKQLFVEKTKRNPSFSLRALAAQLGMAPSTLSEIFSDKKNLSVEKASEVAIKIGLNEKETQYFCLLVQLETAKSVDVKNSLQERLNNLNPKKKAFDSGIDAFKMISDWYHLAILTLCSVTGLTLTAEVASKRLSISKVEASLAIERLSRLELLEQTPQGHYRKTKDNLLVDAPAPSEAMKNYHKQYLDKAKEALISQTPKERLSRSESIAFDVSQLKEADALMDEFYERFNKLAEKSKKRGNVYQLSCHFFNLTPTGDKKS
jgi:uncharacterized protein (TIGR02147 family)